MGIFLASFDVKVAIVTTSRHRLVCHVQDGLQLVALVKIILTGLVDTNLPGHTLWIDAASGDFPTNLYHEVLDIMALQQTCYDIDTIALGNGRKIEHHAWLLHDDGLAVEADMLHAYKLSQTVDLFLGGHLFVLETKAPGIYQWRNGNVEGAIGLVIYLACQLEYFDEVTGQFGLFASVYACYKRLCVEHRELFVNLF